MTEELHPFAVYLIKAGQFFCSAAGLKDEDILTEKQLTNQLLPMEENDILIRPLNGVEIESCLYIWTVVGRLRYSKWKGTDEQFVVRTVSYLKSIMFWHLARWQEITKADIGKYWGIRRHQNMAVWVQRPPDNEEKFREAVENFGLSLFPGG